MTETHSKSRQRAEFAFSNIQSQFYAKNNPVEELESEAERRDAKTFRLREARLAQELAHRTLATSALLAKRAKTR
jgi:hypothetical protein